MAPQLYTAQLQGVTRCLRSDPRRHLLAYSTGCGKTATALTALQRHVPSGGRVLVICPAMVRRHWQAEAKRWIGATLAPLEHGRVRALSGPKAKIRDAAYAADWRVVSYDLVRDVDQGPYDAVVLDEIHHLAHWASRQSTRIRHLVDLNPQAMVLGLSATLIPTELTQLWHPLRVLFGAAWGDIPRTGPVNWSFARAYCQVVTHEYGTEVKGARADRLPALKKRLSRVAHRLTREDIAADLPPLCVEMLPVPGCELTSEGEMFQVGARVVEWAKSLPEDIHHSVVLAYHRPVGRALAQRIAELGLCVEYIDGTLPPAQRLQTIDRAEKADRCVLVATSESVREGIRMMWAQRVLLAQWRQSPAQVTQVLGRFQSIGDARRPQIQILTDDSLYGAACKLLERAAAINAVLQAGKAEAMIQQVFAPKPLTEERMGELTRNMLHTTHQSADDWRDDSEARDAW